MGKPRNIGKIAAILGVATLICVVSGVLLLGQNVSGAYLVIPLLVRGAQMPAEDELPSGLQKLVYRNGIPIRPDPDFHRDMDRLIAALRE